MLLSSRREGLIRFCLAGMEIAWITPFVALLFHQQGLGWSPMLVLGALLAVLSMWILALEFLSRLELDSPAFELTVVGLVVLSTVVLVRLWLYGGAPLNDFSWLPSTFDALFNFHRGLRPELVLVLANLLLWQRATSATSRSLDFFSVGVSFRMGILVLILGAGLLSYVSGYDVRALFWLYLLLGLTAVAVARIREKASSGGSVGPSLPIRRLAALLVAVGLTVGSTALVSLLFTPTSIKAALGWLEPVWRVVGLLLQPLLVILVALTEIVFVSLESLLRHLAVGEDSGFFDTIRDLLASFTSMAGRSEGAGLALPPWVQTLLRYTGVLLGILVMLGLVLLSLNKIRSRSRRDDSEEETEEEITLGGSTLGRGMRWLREKAGLVRRFGLGRHLLAAISVQNMYANLSRLARRRGYGRHPAQPADDYLPLLVRAFGGHEESLARITAAYMRVHYGDQPITRAELGQLRRDYDGVRTAETQP